MLKSMVDGYLFIIKPLVVSCLLLECLISEIMGCECCKELSPKDYKKCKSDMDYIKKRNGTSEMMYQAPCGAVFKFGAKFTAPKSKKRKKK